MPSAVHQTHHVRIRLSVEIWIGYHCSVSYATAMEELTSQLDRKCRTGMTREVTKEAYTEISEGKKKTVKTVQKENGDGRGLVAPKTFSENLRQVTPTNHSDGKTKGREATEDKFRPRLPQKRGRFLC